MVAAAVTLLCIVLTAGARGACVAWLLGPASAVCPLPIVTGAGCGGVGSMGIVDASDNPVARCLIWESWTV